MNAKTVEILDSRTFIPALAVRLDPFTDRDRYLIDRAGYGATSKTQGGYIVLIHLTSLKCATDPMDWGNRTMKEAHRHIYDRGFDNIEHGEVIDVQFILDETQEKKPSEELL